jgi:hypothetical protein
MLTHSDLLQTTEPSPLHEEFRLAIIAAMAPFDNLDPIEQLAILCILVGQLIAMQDSRCYTSESISEMVHSNIQLGNMRAVTAVVLGEIDLENPQ